MINRGWKAFQKKGFSTVSNQVLTPIISPTLRLKNMCFLLGLFLTKKETRNSP